MPVRADVSGRACNHHRRRGAAAMKRGGRCRPAPGALQLSPPSVLSRRLNAASCSNDHQMALLARGDAGLHAPARHFPEDTSTPAVSIHHASSALNGRKRSGVSCRFPAQLPSLTNSYFCSRKKSFFESIRSNSLPAPRVQRQPFKLWE